MVETKPKSKVAGFRALIERRSRRGWWVYVMWLVVYLITALMFADEMAFHRGAKVVQMLPLLIPVLILLTQLTRPTVLGWLVICLPTFLYFGIGVYYIIANNLGPHPQWEYDSQGVVLGAVFLTMLLGVCIVLTCAARPKELHSSQLA